MMVSEHISNTQIKIKQNPKTWLITGVSGFIGSHLLEHLLSLNQNVVGLDNMSIGTEQNLLEVKQKLKPNQWERFKLLIGDIRDLDQCMKACAGIDYILHQAALCSVQDSIRNNIPYHDTNITGFLNILIAAKQCGVKTLVYASSSAIYGDNTSLPLKESAKNAPLSFYAASKSANELFSSLYTNCYDLDMVGLRYFNVFGPRQNPNGPYSGVISKWIKSIINNENIVIYGDGSSTRDYCYVSNVVQANILAATAEKYHKNEVYNVGASSQTSLIKLASTIIEAVKQYDIEYDKHIIYKKFREGDIAHSVADIKKAKTNLGYRPEENLLEKLITTIDWYIKHSINHELNLCE